MIQKLLNSNSYVAERGFLLLCAIFFVLWTAPAAAQPVMGARELGMGQAATALPSSGWALFSNPAMMDSTSSVTFYSIRYYGMADLTDMAFAFARPAGSGTAGVGVHRYGDELFSQSRVRLAYKNDLEGFHYGIALTYLHLSQGGGYGTVGTLGMDLGVAAKLAPALWVGSRATNVNQPEYGTYSAGLAERPPREISIGLAYLLSEKALFTADAVKDVGFPLSWRTGLEVRVIEQLRGRAGFSTAPLTFAGGFGWNTERWGANVGVQQHGDPVLGSSPGIDLYLLW